MKLKRFARFGAGCFLAFVAVMPPAQATDPFLTSTGITLRILFVPTATAIGTTATARASTTAATEKQALAAVALEDAAHFYGSGEISGVLPTVLKQLRSENPELARLKDAELVDSVVEAAEQFISSQTPSPQGSRENSKESSNP
jgi:hypothetical protein